MGQQKGNLRSSRLRPDIQPLCRSQRYPRRIHRRTGVLLQDNHMLRNTVLKFRKSGKEVLILVTL